MREIESMAAPDADPTRLSERVYREAYQKQVHQFELDRGARIKALLADFPNDPKVKRFALDLWLRMARMGEEEAVLSQTASLDSDPTNAIDPIELLYIRAEARVWTHSKMDDATLAVEEFLHVAPRDERGAELLFFLAGGEKDRKKQAEIYRRAAAGPYGNSSYGKMANSKALQTDAIGKPFDLTFTDAMSGTPISVQKDLKGKIVVVIFWATWCGPCIAETPENKRLYAANKARGVEFISVSLDYPESAGGMKAMKDYVAKNSIPWPQYYQGNGPESAFSSKWRVGEIPQIFVVGRDGNLAEVNASGSLSSTLRQMLDAERTR
jgi:thiol-disulfide isomerase/thioredoxin